MDEIVREIDEVIADTEKEQWFRQLREMRLDAIPSWMRRDLK